MTIQEKIEKLEQLLNEAGGDPRTPERRGRWRRLWLVLVAVKDALDAWDNETGSYEDLVDAEQALDELLAESASNVGETK